MTTIEKLTKLVLARQKLVNAKLKAHDLEMALYAGADYQNNAKDAEDAQAEIDALTQKIKEDGMASFRTSGDKKQPGGTVKEFNDYPMEYDTTAIKTWAIEKAPALVDLNKNKFEKYALAALETNPVPGVKVAHVVRFEFQVSSDLTAYLPEEQAEHNSGSEIPF
jgi:hypothetical protein